MSKSAFNDLQVIGVLIDYMIPQFPAKQGPYVLLVVDSPELVPVHVPAHVSTCREPAAWPASIAQDVRWIPESQCKHCTGYTWPRGGKRLLSGHP